MERHDKVREEKKDKRRNEEQEKNVEKNQRAGLQYLGISKYGSRDGQTTKGMTVKDRIENIFYFPETNK